ncbi:MAG: MinD/ParA family protein [Candidatus Bathyarchaeia archaeon]
MGKMIAVHSYKGGTGKTLISTNLAAALAKQGEKVCLMDLDFRAPSLASLLGIENMKYWINDYLNGICDVEKTIMNMSHRIAVENRFFTSLANPSLEAIRDMSSKDRKWEMKALTKLLSLKNSLLSGGKFEYIVMDTSPGLQYSSINAIVAADIVLVVTTMDKSDALGTRKMLRELYDIFEKKTGLILNKVMYEEPLAHEEELQQMVKETYGVHLLAAIPCFCDIIKAYGKTIFVHEKPNHPFADIINKIIIKIKEM